jgi:hypothetical protein
MKISNLVKAHLKLLPYTTEPVTQHNLYISCLLSLLNSVTLSNTIKNKIKSKEVRTSDLDEFLYRVYADTAESSILLFHLPASMENYVATTVARIRHMMSRDLRDLIGMNTVSEEICEAMLISQA